MGRELTALTVAVALQLLVTVAHGVVHEAIPVETADWQLVYVVAVLHVAPIVGVVVARTGHPRRGAALVAVAGVAGLAFEGLFHFVVPGPDHVGHVTRGWLAFATTAALSTVGDVVAASVGGWAWWRLRD